MRSTDIRTIIVTIGEWSAVGFLCITMYGCVAQQADVVKIKRELDAKISQLDKSKTSLQQAVNEANQALEDASGIISKQRGEIKELLHARAELMEQMASLKETDLSQVRGALENNQHQMGELTQRFGRMETEMQSMRVQVEQSQTTLEPLVSQVRERLAAGEQLLTEQGGKLGEFRSSLVDYQQALGAIRQSLAKQDQQISELKTHVDVIDQAQTSGTRQAQANFEEIRRSIQSVIGTMEKVTTNLGSRLDEHEQKLNRMASLNGNPMGLQSRAASSPEHLHRKGDVRRPEASPNLPSFQSLTLTSPPSSADTSRVQAAATVGVNAVALVPSVKPFSGQVTEDGQKKDSRILYEEAFQSLREGNYVKAATEFSNLLRSYPESPLASNAQYWLAECYYGQRRFQEAIDEFERVFLLYPSSNKVPASLLKIGYSHLERQDGATAWSVFQQLIRTYPQSPEAIKAQSRLQEVNALLKTPS
ncbi:MAG: tol-pal system protein YbgF [Nitrospirales bacterium]